MSAPRSCSLAWGAWLGVWTGVQTAFLHATFPERTIQWVMLGGRRGGAHRDRRSRSGSSADRRHAERPQLITDESVATAPFVVGARARAARRELRAVPAPDRRRHRGARARRPRARAARARPRRAARGGPDERARAPDARAAARQLELDPGVLAGAATADCTVGRLRGAERAARQLAAAAVASFLAGLAVLAGALLSGHRPLRRRAALDAHGPAHAADRGRAGAARCGARRCGWR